MGSLINFSEPACRHLGGPQSRAMTGLFGADSAYFAFSASVARWLGT